MRTRRWTAVVAVAAVLVVASSCTLRNPGAFTMTLSPASTFVARAADGSTIVIAGQPLTQPMAPACSDGLDDDADGLVDYPADPACTGPGDASERLDGAQPFSAATIPIDVSPGISVDPGQMTFPAFERCVGAGLCFTLQLAGVPGAQAAFVDADGKLAVALPVTLRIEGLTFTPGCQIGPSVAPAALTAYGADGHATLGVRYSSIPEVTTCGGDWDWYLTMEFTGSSQSFDLTLDGRVLDAAGRPLTFGPP